MHRATPDVGKKSLSYETALVEPAAMTAKDAALSFMERVLAVNTGTRVTKDVADTVVDGDSEATEHKPQPSRSVAKPSSDTRSEIKRVFDDLGAVTKTNVEVIFETHLSKWTSTTQWKIVNSVKYTLKDALQASYFNLNMASKQPCTTSSNKLLEKWSDLVGPLHHLSLRCVNSFKTSW